MSDSAICVVPGMIAFFVVVLLCFLLNGESEF